MKKFSSFVRDLHEVKGVGPGGYKIPFDVGPGWSAPKKEYHTWKFVGKGKYKGLFMNQFSEEWISSSLPSAAVGKTWTPWIQISCSDSRDFIGRIVAPPVAGSAPKGNWIVYGITTESAPLNSNMSDLKKIGEHKRMSDAIKQVVDAAVLRFGPIETMKNGATHTGTPRLSAYAASQSVAKVAKEKPVQLKAGQLSLEDAISKVRQFLGGGAKAVDQRDLHGKTAASIEVRYWGKWEMPPGEEDDGDYDWEVLTRESRKKMNDFIDDLKKKVPDYIIVWSTEEKNWLHIDFLKKK